MIPSLENFTIIMSSTELSMLDLAERGESHGSLVDGQSLGQPASHEKQGSHTAVEPIAQTRRPSTTQDQKDSLGEGDLGPVYLSQNVDPEVTVQRQHPVPRASPE
jgi:hypothetical protein